jgi:hypothetical protein
VCPLRPPTPESKYTADTACRPQMCHCNMMCNCNPNVPLQHSVQQILSDCTQSHLCNSATHRCAETSPHLQELHLCRYIFIWTLSVPFTMPHNYTSWPLGDMCLPCRSMWGERDLPETTGTNAMGEWEGRLAAACARRLNKKSSWPCRVVSASSTATSAMPPIMSSKLFQSHKMSMGLGRW